LKSKFTQRRYRAPKRSECALCKPHQQGWADKNGATGASDMAGKAAKGSGRVERERARYKTFADVRRAVAHEQQVCDWEKESVGADR